MEYIIYWYHLEQHTNPYTEGYIGVTNNEQRRHLEHCRYADNGNKTHFCNAINKYGIDNIIKDILHKVNTAEEAFDLEYLYRNQPNIGWNSAIGGDLQIGEYVKTPITLYHQSDPENEKSYNSITEAAEDLGLSEGRLRQAKHRQKPLYGYDGWAILFDESFDKSTTKTINQILSENQQKPKTKPSYFKGMTNRWTEEQKAKIGTYHKGKTISEEAKESSRQKNRLNNPQCKQISLRHKDNPEQVYTYHSISEASRQLQLPLSRLKSKARGILGTYGRDGWAIISLGSE